VADPSAAEALTAVAPALPPAPAGNAVAPGADDNDAVPANAQDAMQVLDHGPIHEAFAEPIVMDPNARPTVDKEPPAPINEVPPDVKPEGNDVQWIPGYWMWSDDKHDFIWVSGVWRDMPPGRRWVPGHWSQEDGKYAWVSGFWADDQRQEVQMLPNPPESLEVGPNTPAPAANYFWVPGIWNWQGAGYAWRPGYWYAGQTNWVWIPDYYCYTPYGAIFVNGYWDYPLVNRGLLYAPIWWSSPVYGYSGFYYRPYRALNSALLLSALFVNGNYGHYYYGWGSWWNGGNWGYNGFWPWWAWNGHRHGYDPFYNYHRWHDGHNRHDWVNNVRQDFNRHQQQLAGNRGPGMNQRPQPRPNLHAGPDRLNQLIQPARQLANQSPSLRLRELSGAERQAARNQVQNWQKMRDARVSAENLAAKAGGVNITAGKPSVSVRQGDGARGNLPAQLGARAAGNAAGGNTQQKLRIDTPNGPRSSFRLPAVDRLTGNGQVKAGNQVGPSLTGGNGTIRNNNSSSNGGNSLTGRLNGGANGSPFRDLRGNPFSGGGQGSGGNAQSNVGGRTVTPRGDFNPGAAPKSADSGSATGVPQPFRAARPQIDSAIGNPGRQGFSPFQQGGTIGSSGRVVAPRPGGGDAGPFRGNMGGFDAGAGQDRPVFRSAPRTEFRMPSSGGAGNIQVPSGGQSFRSFQGGGGGAPAIRSFPGGGGSGGPSFRGFSGGGSGGGGQSMMRGFGGGGGGAMFRGGGGGGGGAAGGAGGGPHRR
jgi:hypothetical protein